MALGLLASAFARSEFQAVQFMPLVVLPQFLLCGLLVPWTRWPRWLQAISHVLPLTYAVEATREVIGSASTTGTFRGDVAILAGFAVALLALGAGTLRRRTA